MLRLKPHWLLPVLALLAVAAPLLGSSLANDAEAQEPGPIRSITIFEGFNLIVWGATPLDAEQFADSFPAAIVAIFGWDGAQAQFDTWRRTGPDFANSLPNLEPNRAIWILSEESAPFDFQVRDIEIARVDTVDGGLDLIGWTGLDTPIVDALAGLGDIQVNLFNNETKVFRTYTTGLPDAIQGATTLRRGDAFWLSAPAGALVSIPSPLGSTTIALNPSADNTIYSEAELSNGAGQNLFAGRANTGNERRALVKFDLATIPAGSTIESVELSLTVNKTTVGDVPFTLHPLTADWGEGASDAAQNEGRGQAAQPGDATWLQRSTGQDLPWATAGSDLANQSAAVTIGAEGAVSIESAGLTADVQRWLEDPDSNFGWILLPDADGRSAKRFGSREGNSPPTLNVTFTPPE
ncbi:MAG TPA: DNRLRE domain-containing protein [Dehalococcoidia bacterium]|nr:DNRLRE domain-containing protein [Dehalococcoidia bacterium]